MEASKELFDLVFYESVYEFLVYLIDSFISAPNQLHHCILYTEFNFSVPSTRNSGVEKRIRVDCIDSIDPASSWQP